MRAWLRALDGAQKRAFAQKMGVTVRTVQRWGIEPGSGSQARAFIPKKLLDVDPNTWALGFKQRGNTSTVIEEGLRRSMPPGLPRRTFEERFRNIRDAMRFMLALARGDVDKWLRAGWDRARLVRDGDGWKVVVSYVGGGGTYGGGIDLATGSLLPPEGLLSTPGTSDPFGDILLQSYD